MRATRIGLVLTLALGLACRSGSSVPESGAALLQLSCSDGVQAPDELRVWAYDDGGVLWNGARIPEQGALSSSDPAKLGTILVAPGTIRGALRIHIRAFALGVRVADGMLSIPSLASGDRTFALRLEPTTPADIDGDDVPDAIDDCVGVANPNQGGCSVVASPDAGGDAFITGPSGLDGGGQLDGAARDSTGADDLAGGQRNPDGDRLPDTNGTMKVDAQTNDSPIDAPSTVETDAQTIVRLDAGSVLMPDGGVTMNDATIDITALADLGIVRDAGSDRGASLDLAPQADGAALPLDAGSHDVPEGDVCGTNCKKSQGELCASNDECASTFCADGVCCTNACAGACRSCNQPSAVGTCQGYTAGTDPEMECGGTKCNGVGACGTVIPTDKPNGQICATADECRSGICRDGVCCNEACDQPCQACGSGTCLPIKRADDVPECAGTMTCNPAGKCIASSG